METEVCRIARGQVIITYEVRCSRCPIDDVNSLNMPFDGYLEHINNAGWRFLEIMGDIILCPACVRELEAGGSYQRIMRERNAADEASQ